ncbi:ABC transporter substrate-binding protein [Shinella sp.]|uniref:ABC transporter substrate-binding protein n=1 Tax=Shinella sp. TaxID=1870904 RepID=UPI0039E23958
MHKSKAIGAAALVLVLSLPALADERPPVVLGFAIAQSGFMAPYDGESSAKAVELWMKDQNAKGGLLGRKVTAVYSDTKSDRIQGAKAGLEVVREGANMVIVSCDYDMGAPAALAAQQAGLVSMFLCAEDPKAGVQGAGPYAFTSSVASQVQGATMAEWAYEKLGTRRPYLLLDTTSEYNKSLCAGFEWAAAKLDGLEIAGSDSFRNEDASIQPQITRISSLPEPPDAIMVCSGNPGAPAALRQIRGSGLNMPLLEGSTMDGTYWMDAVPGLTDFYVPVQASIYGDDPRPAVQAFNAKFKEAYGSLPISQYTYPAYAFMELWGRAVEQAGTLDAAAVVPILESFKDAPTYLGPRSFSPEMHIQTDSPYLIVKTTDGKPAVVGEHRIAEPIPFNVLFRLKD